MEQKKKKTILIALLVILAIILIIVFGNRSNYVLRKIEYATNIFDPSLKKITVSVNLPVNSSKKKITKNFEKLIVEMYNTKGKPHIIQAKAYGPKDSLDATWTIANVEFVTDGFTGKKSYFKKNKLNIQFKTK